jgi:hypothetical protein
MPELYGNPRKDELRKQIRELTDGWNAEGRAHRETRAALDLALVRVELLTNKIQSMEGMLKSALAEASKEVSSDEVWELDYQRKEATRQARRAALYPHSRSDGQ